MTDRGSIYLVVGFKGEYSDYAEWNLAAWTDEARAIQHEQLAREMYAALLSKDENERLLTEEHVRVDPYLGRAGERYWSALDVTYGTEKVMVDPW